MSADVYARLGKVELLTHPIRYSWNCVLSFVQFTQEELLQIRSHLHIPTLIRAQKCLTREFLRSQFADEINACPDVDWNDVETYVPK